MIPVLIIFLFLATPRILLFYDAPEYADIISHNSFFRSVTLGHPPIHPVFVAALWLATKICISLFHIDIYYAGNISAFIFSLFSIFIFTLLNRKLENKHSLLTIVLFFMLPGIWIVSTNLMVESIAMPVFMGVILLGIDFQKQERFEMVILYVLSIALLIGIHLEMIVWLPAVIAVPLLFPGKNAEPQRFHINKFMKLTFAGTVLGILLYNIIYWLGGKNILQESLRSFFGRMGDHYDFSFAGLLRMTRNIFLSTVRGFGAGTVFIFLLSIFRMKKDRSFINGLFLLSVSLIFAGAIWTGDFMIRRVIFAGVFISLIITRINVRSAYATIIFLIPIFFSNFLLYAMNNPGGYPIHQMKENQSELDAKSVLIQTHYLRPFAVSGSDPVLIIGENDLNQIPLLLKNQYNVYLDSQAVFAPYLLYTGNNLHVTSLGKFGKSESEGLFRQYSLNLGYVRDIRKRIYFYSITANRTSYEERKKLIKTDQYKDTAVIIGETEGSGIPVYLYSNDLGKRIHRERIDYGDVFTWVWVLISSKKDPLYWTYSDKEKVFIIPVSRTVIKNAYIQGEGIKRWEIL